jgi:hypothetical protein
LGQRSRKRGRRAPASGSATAAKPARSASSAGATSTAVTSRPRRRNSEERNAAVRAGLQPLAPGERPLAITIGSVLALLSGGLQLALFIFGVKLEVAGTHAEAGSTIVFGVMMLVCSIGMWYLRYWAVLGFMAILGITVLYFALALIKASSLVGFAIGIVGMGLGGWLFYKLVRALSRIQMPEYPGR